MATPKPWEAAYYRTVGLPSFRPFEPNVPRAKTPILPPAQPTYLQRIARENMAAITRSWIAPDGPGASYPCTVLNRDDSGNTVSRWPTEIAATTPQDRASWPGGRDEFASTNLWRLNNGLLPILRPR